MGQELQKAADLIAKSEHIALLLPERPDIDCYAAAEAIARACEARGKYVGFLPSVAPDAANAPEECVKTRRPNPLVREFVIGIETAAVPVAQLRYEKREDRIDIILSPKSSPIREDSFSFREGKIQCDCVIALGVPDIDALPALAGVEPSFFTDTPIIAIGDAADHRAYGEVNILSSVNAPLSETAAALLAALSGKTDAVAATLLLAGIIAHTDGFRASLSRTTHTAAAELLGLGADHARAAALAEARRPFTLRQLAARAAVRSKQSDDGRVLWSFLTAEDFEKTGRLTDDTPAVSSALAHAFPNHHLSVLLWQDPGMRRVRASLRGERILLDAIAEREPGTFQSPTFALTADFESFGEGEERIASLLREVL